MTEDPDPNATGALSPLPGAGPGATGREAHEREAAFARAEIGPAGWEAQRIREVSRGTEHHSNRN